MSQTNKKKALLLLERSVNTRRFHLQNKKDAPVTLRVQDQNGDDRSLIIAEHAWCLETVGLGYRNVSLSGHPLSVFSLHFF